MFRRLTRLLFLQVLAIASTCGCQKATPPDDAAETAAAVSPAKADGGDAAQSPDGAEASQSAQPAQALASGPMVRRPPVESDLQLPPLTSFDELADFLKRADGEIRRLGTLSIGPQDRQAVAAEVQRVAKLKQEAAERMLEETSLDPEQEAVAIGARMQALSHRAALGDLPAATALEAYAIELLNHPVDAIARDSRTVLAGFALERLQGGETQKPDEVLRFADELTSQPELLDASSIKLLQRAMLVLSDYGYTEAATTIRQSLESFAAETRDARLAALAADVLGASRFDQLESLRAGIAQADAADDERWQASAARVARQHPDALTANYLVDLALQLEALDRPDAAAGVYQVLDSELSTAADSDAARAARDALAARDARREIIGQPVQLAGLKTLDGQRVDEERLQGHIVLAPFWSLESRQSLTPLSSLEQMVAEHQPRLQLLGVNMDVDAAVREQATQLSTDTMRWPSIAAASVGGNPYASPLASELGVVSIPVVVVLDGTGRVAAVALSQAAVEQTVARLLQSPAQ